MDKQYGVFRKYSHKYSKNLRGLVRHITLADLSREPVRKCEPSADFASDVIGFLWPDSLSDSLSSFPVYKMDRKFNTKDQTLSSESTELINKERNMIENSEEGYSKIRRDLI